MQFKIAPFNCRTAECQLQVMENVIGFCLDKILMNKPKEVYRHIGENLFTKDKEYHAAFDGICVNAFLEGGWIFVEETPELRRMLNSGKIPGGTYEFGRICRDKDEVLKVSVNQMQMHFQPDVSEAQITTFCTQHKLKRIHKYRFADNFYAVQIPQSEDPLLLSLKLMNSPEVIQAEPEFVENMQLRSPIDDPDFDKQWQWKNIQAEEAWQTTRGESITIAIVDQGCDIRHADLQGAVNNHTGYFKDKGKFDPFNKTKEGFPVQDHGTVCAGMMVARADNQLDGVGVAHKSDFTAIACLDDKLGKQSTLARAIAYAANYSTEDSDADEGQGVDIISCSVGPSSGLHWRMKHELQVAIDFAVTKGRGGKGTPIFWAVTNANFDISFDEVVSYKNTIAVSKSRPNDKHASAGFGEKLDFLAPGEGVVTTTAGGATREAFGTSLAAPCAAGVGALVLSANPQLKWHQVREIMRKSCDQVGGIQYVNNHHPRYGFGRINAAKAVALAKNFIV